MGLYTGQDNYPENIYTFEETDVVRGGDDGKDNKPLKELANRTTYLYNRMGAIRRLQGDRVITADDNITADDSGKEIVAIVSSDSSLTITLAAIDSFPPGAIIAISTFMLGLAGVINIVGTNGQGFYDPFSTGSVRSSIHFHNKEHLLLVACGTHWKLLYASDSSYMAGEETKSRRLLRNTLIPNGALLSRALYPRLWLFVQSLTMGQEVTTEANWLSGISGNILYYRGLYSIGDGATTFRIPDERGMHERMVDLGRGIDIYRPHNYPGGYEKDGLLDHYHFTNINRNSQDYVDGAAAPNNIGTALQNGSKVMTGAVYNYDGTIYQGQNDNTVKNIGKLFLIKF